ncbi:MAG: BrnA antitoxin family protein [Terracidiphilus sp.]
MKTKMVRYTLESLPPLTDAQRANLKALAARPANEIDTSDVPVLTDAEWAKTPHARGHLYRPVKQIVTARLDKDVLEWLKSHGRGYQSRMNAILRREMLSSAKPAAAR